MLDKNKKRTDTCREIEKKSQELEMPVTARRIALSETARAAKMVAANRGIRESIRMSVSDSREGRVVAREQAIKRLKKHVS